MSTIQLKHRMDIEMSKVLTDLRTVLNDEDSEKTVKEVYYLARQVVDLVHDEKKLTNAIKAFNRLDARYGY